MEEREQPKSAIERAAESALKSGRNPREIFNEAVGHLSKFGGEERFKKTIEKWQKALRLNI